MVLWNLHCNTPLQIITSSGGHFTGATFSSPFLITTSASQVTSDHVTSDQVTSDNAISTKGHVTVYRLTDSTILTQVSELTLPHEVISCAASTNQLVLLTSQPNMLLFDLVDGVVSNERVVEGDHDITTVVKPAQPDTTKVSRTEGFTEYFERKRKRIEEESLKETLKANS